jgi:dCMP deaminase
MKRRVGAVLVRSKRILSTGYNGTPRGVRNCNQGGCRRCNGSARGGEARKLPQARLVKLIAYVA